MNSQIEIYKAKHKALTEAVQTHILDTYSEEDTFLCGGEVYTRDELSADAIANELEENGRDMVQYIAEMEA
jgi:superfamily II DNA helicase RecQ